MWGLFLLEICRKSTEYFLITHTATDLHLASSRSAFFLYPYTKCFLPPLKKTFKVVNPKWQQCCLEKFSVAWSFTPNAMKWIKSSWKIALEHERPSQHVWVIHARYSQDLFDLSFFLWALRFLIARATITPAAGLGYNLPVGKLPGDHLGFTPL